MKAITIKQPWAELIIRGRKDVENRSWPTHHRGLLVIHAGLGFDEHEPRVRGPFDAGAIIGIVHLVDCIKRSGSPWGLRGHWHWMLSQPQRLTKPIPYKGAQGFWTVDPETEWLLCRQLQAK